MVGKRVQFDDETWAAIEAAASESGRSFQDVADVAFADFLKKHKQPVGLKAALKESVGERPNKSGKRVPDTRYSRTAPRPITSSLKYPKV